MCTHTHTHKEKQTDTQHSGKQKKMWKYPCNTNTHTFIFTLPSHSGVLPVSLWRYEMNDCTAPAVGRKWPANGSSKTHGFLKRLRKTWHRNLFERVSVRWHSGAVEYHASVSTPSVYQRTFPLCVLEVCRTVSQSCYLAERVFLKRLYVCVWAYVCVLKKVDTVGVSYSQRGNCGDT